MKYKYVKPIHRYNSDSKRKVTTNESGYLYLMCPECLYMQKIYKQRCTYMELHHSIKDLNYNETISGECPRCKESVIFQEIDFNIARAVDILNEKGYFTVFSCEGHVGNELDGENFFRLHISISYQIELWCRLLISTHCQIHGNLKLMVNQ